MKSFGAIGRSVLGLTALTLLAACPDVGAIAPPSPPVRPTPPPITSAPQAALPSSITQPSQASRALSVHYRRLQTDLLNQGLLRGDGGGPDTPFSDITLTRNFVRIALFDEYRIGPNGELQADATVSSLRRWQSPIRMAVEFGASVPQAQRDRDAVSISAFANRLSRFTGVPTRQTDEGANFHVFVLNEGDRAGYEARLRELVPGIDAASVRAFISPPRSTLCLAIAFSDGTSNITTQAVVLIRAEHPDLLRLACIHEELAQSMGLANDSPTARPSIFNDDEEFGLLTTHDELLLQMLYDPRLSPGMTAAQAAPIAREIAAELVDGPAQAF